MTEREFYYLHPSLTSCNVTSFNTENHETQFIKKPLPMTFILTGFVIFQAEQRQNNI